MPRGPVIPVIEPEKLATFRDRIFGKDRFSGTDLARRIGIRHNSLYVEFKRTGIGVKRARQTAEVLTSWAVELLDMATRLNLLARELELDSAANENPTLAPSVSESRRNGVLALNNGAEATEDASSPAEPEHRALAESVVQG